MEGEVTRAQIGLVLLVLLLVVIAALHAAGIFEGPEAVDYMP